MGALRKTRGVHALMVLLGCALAACGSSGAMKTNVVPAIASFTASPTTLPTGGGMVNLEWTVTGASSITIDQGVGDVSTATSKMVSIIQTTTFTLTAKNAAGSVTATASVSVAAPNAPFIDAFTATPTTLPFGGGQTTLTWSVKGATSLSIDNGVGDVTNVASKTVSVTTTTTFTLTATNAGGSSTQTAIVTVGPDTAKPTIVSFTRGSGPPVGGGSVVLQWNVTNANSLLLDDGLGHTTDVSGMTMATVQVPNDLTYTLTATNPNGSVSAMLAFAVTPPDYLNTVVQTTAATGIDYGQPYDSILARPHMNGQAPAVTQTGCMSPSGLCPAAASATSLSTQTVRLIETDEDYLSSLQIDASVSVSSGIYSGNDKFDYFSSHHLKSTSIYLFVDMFNVAGAQRLDNVSLVPSAQQLDPVSFFKKYGDRYAYFATQGGELYGLLEIATQTVEDKQRITNAIQANVSGISGSVAVSNTVGTELDSAITNVTINSYITSIGFGSLSITQYDPTNPASTLAAFLSTLQTAAASKSDATNNLTYSYKTYFGIPGYPGLPSQVPDLVTQHRAVEADYLLYFDITSRDADFGHYFTNVPELAPYVAPGSILANMKAYATTLAGWLTASLADSLSSPAEPAPPLNADITTFAQIDTIATGPDSSLIFNAYAFHNGFVPLHEIDYDIPARYADGNGMLHGATFSKHVEMETNLPAGDPNDIPWQLYVVNEDRSAQLVKSLAYRWPNQVGEFFLPGAFDGTGKVTKATVGAGLGAASAGYAPTINRMYYAGDGSGTSCTNGTCETGYRRFIWVNMASGQVMTTGSPGAEVGVTQTPFTDDPTQYWDFIDLNNNPTVWAPWDPFQLVADDVATTYFALGGFYQCEDLNLAGNGPYITGVNAITDGSNLNGPNGNERFAFYGTNNGWYDIFQAGGPLDSSNKPLYVLAGGAPASPTCSTGCWPSGMQTTLVNQHGYANERWHLVPWEHIYNGQ